MIDLIIDTDSGVDNVDSKPGSPVFNRSVALRDSWAKPQ